MVAADAAGAAAVAVAAAVHVAFAVVVHSIRPMEVALNLFVRNRRLQMLSSSQGAASPSKCLGDLVGVITPLWYEVFLTLRCRGTGAQACAFFSW
jgi:hypothetical protein